MHLTYTLPQSVYAVWIGTIVIVVLLVPVAVALLHRTLRAAWAIRRYLAEMEAAGIKIAENTSSITALKDTRTVVQDMLKTADGLHQHSGVIAQVLSQRAAKGGLA